MRFKPDVILAAWGVQHASTEHLKIISQAYDSSAVVVAAAGNSLVERSEYPAMFDKVIAVSATSGGGKTMHGANHGSFVDVSAPGQDIPGISYSQHETRTSTGTSPAAAMVAATTAAMRVINSQLSVDQLSACLISSPTPLKTDNPALLGKFGSGMLNIENSLACARDGASVTDFNSQASNGLIPLNGIDSNIVFTVDPVGEFSGARYVVRTPRHYSQPLGTIQFSTSAYPFEVNAEFPLKPDQAFEVSPQFKHFRLQVNSVTELEAHLQYEMTTYDYTKRFCHGTSLLESEGVLSDGSGNETYSYYSDCKWQIVAPEGKLISVTTEHIDTEPNVDKILFFNGTATNQDTVAVLSGAELPPVFLSWTNRLLVWFLSDHKTQSDGWRLNIEFVDR